MTAPAPGFSLTFDDLPVISIVGSEPPFERAVTAALIEALARLRAQATGFVIGVSTRRSGQPDPERLALARGWLDAGHDLGSHTYAHLDFHQVPRAAFEADVLHGDAVVREIFAGWQDGRHGRMPRWFRHPYLHTGRDLASRDAITDLLARHGLRVAPATLIPEDYQFSAAWEWAEYFRNRRRMSAIADAYLEHVTECAAAARLLGSRVFGRDVPQVVGLHANALNAAVLEGVSQRLGDVLGDPIALDSAVADPAYATVERFAEDRGANWLERWATERGIGFPRRVQAPEWIRDAARMPAAIRVRRAAGRTVRALRSAGGAMLRGRRLPSGT